jgi:hypothetical protein
MEFLNKNRFDGMWKCDKQHGDGVWAFSDGVSYTGTWVDGFATEGGIWTFVDGTTREHVAGDGNCGKKRPLPNLSYACGRGSCTVPTHDAVRKYEYDNESDTQVVIEPNGARYVGPLKDNQRHGYGIWKCSCGSEYHGYCKNGAEDGDGVWIFRNGNQYAGKWEAEWENGFGVLSFCDGISYKGNWRMASPVERGKWISPMVTITEACGTMDI